MHPDERRRATAASVAAASGLGLPVDAADVLSDSNTLLLHLRPAGTVARVVRPGTEDAAFVVEAGRRLAEAGAPVGPPDPRVPPRPHGADGFVVTFWSHLEEVAGEPAPDEVVAALALLHHRMREVDLPAPRWTDRVVSARALVADAVRSPRLGPADRDLLATTLARTERAVAARGAPEQLLHGEPHPGNVLATAEGLRFVDLETCCRGPVAFDLAHVPWAVADRYPSVDAGLLADCRVLVLAMVAAWRWEEGDELAGGRRAGVDLVAALRAGPPYPALDAVMREAGAA